MISKLSCVHEAKLKQLARQSDTQQALLELILDWLLVYKVKLPWSEEELVALSKAMRRYRTAIEPFTQRPTPLGRRKTKATRLASHT